MPNAIKGRENAVAIPPLSRGRSRRTSAPVTDPFDRKLRALRRDRAARMGPELFLLDRAFDECLERIAAIARPFERALLLGCPSPLWAERMGRIAAKVDVADPGPIFAARSGGVFVEEDRHDFGEDRFDLCLTVGTLDTVNELPFALTLLHRALKPDAPLVGAIAGGNSLPSLRGALIEAERGAGRIVARTHPRIEASSLAGLLSAAGFAMPVVDLDRVRLRYAELTDLVRDLRGMGATSVLAQRTPALSRETFRRVAEEYRSRGAAGRTVEEIEILHFIGWKPPSRSADY